MDMNSSSSSTMSMSMPMDMIPWLHFDGGDYLLFKAWRPSSHGAIAGACIGLVALAILERWVGGTRGVLEDHWRRRALAIISKSTSKGSSPCISASTTPSQKTPVEIEEVGVNVTVQSAEKSSFQRSLRRIPLHSLSRPSAWCPIRLPGNVDLCPDVSYHVGIRFSPS
ncbi:hypothetical protein A0H81_00550 [Grifola frondosa]|uniref:Copper transport protein n=1 Tax=Grifola frondosa TaxID=5627 RepID=A0A1C7MPQ0_GRIFR|nr:hypothetical protein A0H81_00550 [Grifola frondosa]